MVVKVQSINGSGQTGSESCGDNGQKIAQMGDEGPFTRWETMAGTDMAGTDTILTDINFSPPPLVISYIIAMHSVFNAVSSRVSGKKALVIRAHQSEKRV